MHKIKRYLSRPVIGFLILFLMGWGAVFAQQVPPPEEILGFKVGADYHLETYEQALEYFRVLEAASSRVKLFEMGKTSMGKPKGNEKGTIPPGYVGGITETGVRNIKIFVEEGGILVRSSRRRYNAKFACPGSILRMEFNTKHPVAYGMPEEAPAMFYRSSAFDILPEFEKKSALAITKYSEKDLLMSGYLLGEKYLQNKTAAVDVPLGKGRVILLGYAVQNRAQTHGTFKLFFNSLFYATME